jgi:hypothetical protein
MIPEAPLDLARVASGVEMKHNLIKNSRNLQQSQRPSLPLIK